MSRYELPVRKGTEAFPDTIKRPVAVRFDGVGAGTPLARELLGRYQGQIAAFHKQQVEAYATSTIPIQSQVRNKPGISMRYQNIQGVETIFVKIATPVLEKIEQEYELEFPKRLPDFCVVDLVLPDSAEVELNLIGVFVNPPDDISSDWETDSPNWGQGYSIVPAPIIQYSRWGDPRGSLAYADRVSSLKFDLRGKREDEKIEVDIYAKVIPNEYPIDYYDTYYTLEPPMSGSNTTGEYTLASDQAEFAVHTSGSVPAHGNPSSEWTTGSGAVTDPEGNDTYPSITSGGVVWVPNIADEIWTNNFGSWTTVTYLGSLYDYRTDLVVGGEVMHRRWWRFASTWALDEGVLSSCDDHGSSSTLYPFYVSALVKEQFAVAHETPVYADHYEHMANLTYAFYWDMQEPEAYTTDHQDESGIWAPVKDPPGMPERKLLVSDIEIDDQYYPDTPANYRYLGRITVKRTVKVDWEPA